MSIQPFAVSMPVMCMPWQVAQVRLVGLPRPTVLRCIESLDPERAEHEHVVPARDRLARRVARVVAASAPCAAARHWLPSGRRNAWCCCRARRRRRRRDCAARTPAGRPARRGCRQSELVTCADVDLLLELDDALRAARRERTGDLQMLARPRPAPACASVGARASAIRFMLVGLPVSGSTAAGMPFLPTNGPTPKFWCVVYFVLATGRGRRNTEIDGFALLQPVDAGRCCSRVGSRTTSMVNSGSMRRAVGALRRPRQRDAEQAALEQERMRPRIVRRQIRDSSCRPPPQTADPCRRSRPIARGRSAPRATCASAGW